jgi:hypothetical protein
MSVRPAPRAPVMVRGTVLTHRRRCGKQNCRCADGEQLHESIVLSYSEDGRTRFLMLPAEEVAAVTAAASRYRTEKRKLERRADAGLQALAARLVKKRERGRR